MQDALLGEVTRLGTRAYLAPGYDCGRWVGDEQGRLKRVRNDELGLEGLKTALAWIENKRRRGARPRARHSGAARGGNVQP